MEGPSFKSFELESAIPENLRNRQSGNRKLNITISDEDSTSNELYFNRTPKNVDYKIFQISTDNKNYISSIHSYIKCITKCNIKSISVNLLSEVSYKNLDKNTIYDITFENLDIIPIFVVEAYIHSIIEKTGGLIFTNIDSALIQTYCQMYFIDIDYLKNQNKDIYKTLKESGGINYVSNLIESKYNYICVNKYLLWTKICKFKYLN